jgi:hypothetical protein
MLFAMFYNPLAGPLLPTGREHQALGGVVLVLVLVLVVLNTIPAVGSTTVIRYVGYKFFWEKFF